MHQSMVYRKNIVGFMLCAGNEPTFHQLLLTFIKEEIRFFLKEIICGMNTFMSSLVVT